MLNYSKCRNFIFVTIEDVQKLLPQKLEETMETLAMNSDQAIAALRHFHWNNEKL
jgi:hypothetical protein